MAEALAVLGVVASVTQLADYGARLSVKLFAFGVAVAGADRAIQTMSNEVALTASVLKELGVLLGSDGEARLTSEQAVEAARRTVEECLGVFEELDGALGRSLGKMGLVGEGGEEKARGKARKGAAAMEKLKWPFLQPKMQLLRSQLEKLKSSLSLMLQVLIYAKTLAEK